jgi:hypothetical protein
MQALFFAAAGSAGANRSAQTQARDRRFFKLRTDDRIALFPLKYRPNVKGEPRAVRHKPFASTERAQGERSRAGRNRSPVPRVGSDGWLGIFRGAKTDKPNKRPRNNHDKIEKSGKLRPGDQSLQINPLLVGNEVGRQLQKKNRSDPTGPIPNLAPS